MEVKQGIDLSTLKETVKPLKELEQYINDQGQGVAFEEGDNIMIIALDNGIMRKKRIKKEHFKSIPTVETVQ